MSKVKIEGHGTGTGTFTVTTPSSNTDRTITLPDATGTLLNSDGSGANLTNLPATTSITTTNSSDTVFDHALKVNNSRGSNDSFVSLGFHNRADVNTTGIKGALVFDGTGKSDGIGDFVFCNSTTANIATAVTPSDERVRIQSGGGISFNGDTAAANALDDYEEGTFTPAFGNVTVTNYDAAAGWYIKIGNQVFVEGICSADNYDNSDSSAIQISGLPFTILTGDAYAVFSIYPEKGLNHVSPRLLGITGQTYALGGKFDYGTGQNTNWLAYSLCGSHLRYRFSGHYRV